MYSKEEIIKYDKMKYENHKEYGIALLAGDIRSEEESIPFEEFDEDFITEVNYEDDYFFQLNVNRFGDKLLLEYIKLGDEDGFYKDWSYKKFMETLKEVCDSYDYVFVNNFDKSENDNLFRAFFLSMLVNIKDYKDFNAVFIECGSICKKLIDITEQRLKGIWWSSEYEKDEMLFCKTFLTPYFNSLRFDRVIFNHGNKEFGKDYLLESTNKFDHKEYYGVQVKAGKLSGAASIDIQEIVNQIDMAFEVPYKFNNGTEIYVSKVIIAISGNFTDNAKERIFRKVDRYKFSNLIFISKKELNSIIPEKP
ncbi:MAG: hypothetical protein FH761_07480 [Firmicutes bacterium]|nr:hypothetical protein [Bacillota bacterium]